ncbi:IS5 family transposase [Saccharothrix coeruleofusca]
MSTKIHLAVDGRGLPMRILITPGQAGDNPQLLPLLDGIRVARTGPGHPRVRPEAVTADKAYSHTSTRQAMRTRHVRFTCPERKDQIARRASLGSHGGRPPAFDLGTVRWPVERTFAWLKGFRRLRIRTERRADVHQAILSPACSIICLRKLILN